MGIRSFRDLRVYASAVELRRGVFAASKAWPRDERYSLTDQIRRSSRAVGAILAEAWPKRRYPKHFVAKLSDTHGEAEETGVWLDVAQECGYLDAEAHAPLVAMVHACAGGLAVMIRQPDKWAGPPDTLRDPDTPYDPDPPR